MPLTPPAQAPATLRVAFAFGTEKLPTARRRLLAERAPAVRAGQQTAETPSAEAVALFGVEELTGFGYSTLQIYPKPLPNSGGGSGGDGGSDGGAAASQSRLLPSCSRTCASNWRSRSEGC